MNADIIGLIAQHGGTLGLAIFAIWMLNRVWELRLEEAKRNVEAMRQLQEEMRDVIERNTEMWARLLQRVEK